MWAAEAVSTAAVLGDTADSIAVAQGRRLRAERRTARAVSSSSMACKVSVTTALSQRINISVPRSCDESVSMYAIAGLDRSRCAMAKVLPVELFANLLAAACIYGPIEVTTTDPDAADATPQSRLPRRHDTIVLPGHDRRAAVVRCLMATCRH